MSNDWMADAPCATVDPEVFFPADGVNATAAKKICATCPVATQCLTYALADPSTMGIWGGTSNSQRVAMRRTAA